MPRRVLAARVLSWMLLASASIGCRPEVAAIRIDAASVDLEAGGSLQVVLAVSDSKGRPIEGTVEHPTGIEADWSVTDPAVASVGPAGMERQWRPQALVTALAPGSAELVARCCGDKTARVPIHVRPRSHP